MRALGYLVENVGVNRPVVGHWVEGTSVGMKGTRETPQRGRESRVGVSRGRCSSDGRRRPGFGMLRPSPLG